MSEITVATPEDTRLWIDRLVQLLEELINTTNDFKINPVLEEYYEKFERGNGPNISRSSE